MEKILHELLDEYRHADDEIDRIERIDAIRKRFKIQSKHDRRAVRAAADALARRDEAEAERILDQHFNRKPGKTLLGIAVLVVIVVSLVLLVKDLSERHQINQFVDVYQKQEGIDNSEAEWLRAFMLGNR